MATFKPTIRTKRVDGTHIVYIRCTHNRKVGYIKTNMYVTDKQLKKNEIDDFEVFGKCSVQISEYIKKLNREDNIDDWTVDEIIKYLTEGDNKISFFDYCKKFTDEMINEGREKSAENYQCAVKSLKSFLKKEIMFQDITTKIINDWIKTLADTARAKEAYPKSIKASC